MCHGRNSSHCVFSRVTHISLTLHVYFSGCIHSWLHSVRSQACYFLHRRCCGRHQQEMCELHVMCVHTFPTLLGK